LDQLLYYIDYPDQYDAVLAFQAAIRGETSSAIS
jgi:hypothetical protein